MLHARLGNQSRCDAERYVSQRRQQSGPSVDTRAPRSDIARESQGNPVDRNCIVGAWNSDFLYKCKHNNEECLYQGSELNNIYHQRSVFPSEFIPHIGLSLISGVRIRLRSTFHFRLGNLQQVR